MYHMDFDKLQKNPPKILANLDLKLNRSSYDSDDQSDEEKE